MKGLTRENQDTSKSTEEIKKIAFDIMLDTFNKANYFPTKEQEFLTFAQEVITLVLHEEFSTEMLNKGIDVNTILKTVQEKDPNVKLKSLRIAMDMIPFFKTYLLKGDTTVHEGKGLTPQEKTKLLKGFEKIYDLTIFQFMRTIWKKNNIVPKNDEEFLDFAEKIIAIDMTKQFSIPELEKGADPNDIVAFLYKSDPSFKNKVELKAAGLIDLWHDFHWPRINFEEGYTSGITGGSGLGVTKSPMEKVLEKPLGESEEIQDKFVVYVNNKPVTEYTNGLEAVETVKYLRKKHPDAKFKVVKIHCDSKQIAETEYGKGHQDDRKEREENLRYSRSRNTVADEIRKKLNPNQKTEKEPTKEGQIYSTGGGAGQSYRKFTPKSKGQLDEKCWDTHKQVGMKKKGAKMVPNCIPKEGIEDLKKGLETTVDSSLDAEKAVAKVLMNSPWFKANMQSEDFIKLAKMWLAANRVFLKNHYPSLDFSDINELAHNLHNYYLYANKQLAETKSKSAYKKINKPKKNK